MTERIDNLLRRAYQEDASDVHLITGLPAYFRIHGKLRSMGNEPFHLEDMEEMAYSIMSEGLNQGLDEQGEVDFSYEIEDVSRFRVNIFKQRNGISIAIRLIPKNVPSIDDLNLPAVLKSISLKPQGLVLVTGPTGSGKSTTLVAMIDYINKVEQKHIVTLEDPIEYIHQHNQSIIDQREVGRDTKKFATGLRAALRQDPDVILVGEMRDLETISTAITAAETGHLVFATLHTINAPSTIERIVDVFPAEQQSQIRYQLASVLLAIVSQRLFPLNQSYGRVAANEILINNNAVSNLIRNEKLHQLPNLMQTSRDQGMQTLENHIKELLQKQLVSMEAVRGYLGESGYGSI